MEAPTSSPAVTATTKTKTKTIADTPPSTTPAAATTAAAATVPVVATSAAAADGELSPSTVPPLVPSSHIARRSVASRPLSQVSAKNRLSQYSVTSVPSRSRPVSNVFPMYPSSLPYSLVRDFAYPTSHVLHYGPSPEPSVSASGANTPATEQRRLSDPPASWETKMNWDAPWPAEYYGRSTDVPPIHLGDGPPWSEDEDLQSPVVSSRHRKHKSTSAAYSRPSLDANSYTVDPGYRVEQSEGRYPTQPEDGVNEYVSRRHNEPPYTYRNGQESQLLGGHDADSDCSSCASSPAFPSDQSRYSRDYQFTITSPDEEMHGKAVALYDFEREDENELPLVEGQIILISYRHGEGWLVAEDPKTKESGLVPEAYVRLLRDIEGGMNGLANAMVAERSASPNDSGTPTQAEPSGTGFPEPALPAINTTVNGYNQPVVSTFSTSSKDLDPYPTDQLGIQAGQAPPQVVHYNGQRGGSSQANTPTMTLYSEASFLRRGSQDTSGMAAAAAAGAATAGIGTGTGSTKMTTDVDNADVQLLTDAKMSSPKTTSVSEAGMTAQ
ncbi:SH3 domain-containing protein [Ceratocystis lukuohia]|uniref:NAP1-binding protein 2 n=2 Tax=Ceratocystis TaxID=5157 RepID=A0A0F8B650_CERFI|nr:NAP1-binding protein 2 [Ceratocystis platani]